MDGRRPRGQVPEDHRPEAREGRAGLLGGRLLLDGLRTDRRQRRRQHGRPDGHRARTRRDGALPAGRGGEHPRHDVDRRQRGDEGLQHLRRLPEGDRRHGRRGADLQQALPVGGAGRPGVGGGDFRRPVAECRRAAAGPQGRRAARLLRHLGPLLPLREVPRCEGGRRRLPRCGERPPHARLPRHPGDRRAAGQLPAGDLALQVVLPADRPPQPRAGGQHGRLPRQRGPHVVQPRRDGEPPARPLHAATSSTRR